MALSPHRLALPPPHLAPTPPFCLSRLQAERDIEQRKRELAEARVELSHKQEYEAVKKQIMQVGPGAEAGAGVH